MKKQLMKYIPRLFKPYVVDIYEGKEEFNPVTNRSAKTLIVEWQNGEKSEFANKTWARICINETYVLGDVREED